MPIRRYGIGDTFIQHGSASLLKKEAGFDLNLLYDDIQKAIL
jgi:deoxyxylulose-5-phosphate synthase